MSYFIQTREGDRLEYTNAGRLPSPPAPEVPRRTTETSAVPRMAEVFNASQLTFPRFDVADRGVEGVLKADQIRKSFHDAHCDAFRWYWPDVQRGRYRSDL